MIKKLRVKAWDAAIVILAITITCVSALAVNSGANTNTNVLIQSSGREWVYPLDTNIMVMAAGPLGNTFIQINNRQAWVESSPCVNQVCVAAGFISKHGNWIACLPNRVFLFVEGRDTEENTPDAIAW